MVAEQRDLMDAEQREVFRAIARCPIADEILNHLLDPKSGNDGLSKEARACRDICSYQQNEISKITEKYGSEYQVEFSKETFHMPEPWNGNLGEAEILFVSSNPSFDILETTGALAKKKPEITGSSEEAEVVPKFQSKDWPDDRVEDFFVERFSRKQYRNNYWRNILKYAGYILGKTDAVKLIEDEAIKNEIAKKIAITEVVHCKSPGEEGVEEARSTCFDEHTKKVIDAYLVARSRAGKPGTVVFVGKHSRDIVCDTSFRDELNKWLEKASLLFIPGPNGRTWKLPKAPDWKVDKGVLYPKSKTQNVLKDTDRQELIDDQRIQHV